MIVVGAAGLADQLAALDELEHDLIPYATSTALTKTAQGLIGRLQDEMRVVFDKPTPYTLNALRLMPATKDKLSARVWFKNESDGAQPASVWLAPEVYGGERRNKPAELQLRARGILPAGMYVVPGEGAELDAYGNIKRGQIIKAMSGVKGFSQAGYQANATDSVRSTKKGNAKSYFVMKRAGKPIGIAQRTGKKRGDVKMILAFVAKPRYGERLNFFQIAEEYTREHLPAEFEKAMATVRQRFAARSRRR
ncbi:conserved hypothetical protein [Pseudomonas knackmussii B13]|uniref:Uncharacterized protein n=1 Tax=Pseudomonas knackmussii (strain DSM 6978 / CCUG 54928 / LMG 23759 / B13) TaxID=1301098 RepID=A0A024HNV6_PSEKB|nr:hypothetical protein [Pseudomonas knackmussii]CDF86344.1 conserved hypothetical protein [Pseudomonas knackmussii B13]